MGEGGALPPVLPIVIYNGRRPWAAALDMSELVSSGSPGLSRYQPSQRYFLLDGGRVGSADLPRDNLVSTLIALEKSRDRIRVSALLGELIELLRAQGDAELEKAFRAWVAQVLFPRRFRGVPAESLPRLEEVRTMLEETVREWTAEWVAEGREQGLEQGRAEGLEQGRAAERALLCRQAARKSTPRRRNGCPRRWRRSATRSGWRRSATGSSSAGRKPNCSPVCMPARPGTEEGRGGTARRANLRGDQSVR